MPATAAKPATTKTAVPDAMLDSIRGSLVRTAMACFLDDEMEPIQAYPHQKLIAFLLERPWFGNTNIIAPPGFAKTWWAGIFFGAWFVAHNPNVRLTYVSNSLNHAKKQAKVVRDTIARNQMYRLLFPEIEPDPNRGWGEISWYVQRPNSNIPDPTWYAVGMDGAVIGSRVDLLILDDLNTQQQQRSEDQRENVRDWVANTAITRLTPKAGRAINIQTRWHERDICGWCYDDHWTTLRFQAMAQEDGPRQEAELTVWTEEVRNAAALELLRDGWQFQVEQQGSEEKGDTRWVFTVFLHDNGPSLWPERFAVDKLVAKRRTTAPRDWACIYQGSPIADDGNIIPIEKFQRYRWDRQNKEPLAGELPNQWVTKIQAWDTAYSEKTSADYSVCSTWGLARDGTMWLLDLLRKRMAFPDLKLAARDQFLKHRPDAVLVEEKASGISLVQELQRPVDGVRLPLVKIQPDRDKVSRAFAITGYIAAELVHIPADAPWTEEFLRECALFPASAHDDQVDAMVYALGHLIKCAAADVPEEEWDGGSTFLGNVRAMEF